MTRTAEMVAVGRIRLIGLLVGFLLLLVPASASADTFTWGLPGDFSGASNPETKYGANSWSYTGGSSNAALTCSGGSAGSCSDGSGDSIAPSGTNIVMTAAPLGGTVTIAWTNPVAAQATVTSTLAAGSCLTGSLSSVPTTIAPGATMAVTLTGGLLGCSASGTIGITATTTGGGGGGGGGDGGGGGGNSAGLALASPGSSPLHIAAPTLTGTSTVASGTVSVSLYAGASAAGTPVRTLTGAISGGHFAVTVLPSLGDGQYTAVASETVGSVVSTSPPVTFRIKVFGPALTLAKPGRRAKVNRKHLQFSGAAGTELGDAPAVTIYLYRGKSAFRHRVGKVTVTAHGSSWSSRWPKPLPVGFYTVVAAQHDDAGHTTHTSPRTFKLVK